MPIENTTGPPRIRRITAGLAVACGVVLATLAWAPPAAADRACELPASQTGRTCPVAVCIALQDEVNAICKGPPPPKACRNVFGCSLRIAMKQRWLNCYTARSTINGTCWGGGDYGHWERQIDAINQFYACDAEIAKPRDQGGCADPCPWGASLTGLVGLPSVAAKAVCRALPSCDAARAADGTETARLARTDRGD